MSKNAPGRLRRPWRPWRAPPHWLPRNKETLWIFRQILIPAVFGILFGALFNILAPGEVTLDALVLAYGLFLVVIYVKMSRDWVYHQDFNGALKRFIAGLVVGAAFALPLGVPVQSILMATLMFVVVNLLSISLFTYTKFLNVNDARERLLEGRPAVYRMGLDWNPKPQEAPYAFRGGFINTMTSSGTGWLTVCRECLSLVGDEDTTCWRCEQPLSPPNRFYVRLSGLPASGTAAVES